MLNGERLLFGNQALMQQYDIDVSAALDKAQVLASDAKTPMYFAKGETFSALVAVSDPIKSDSIDAIKRLKDKGIHLVMLTGDNEATAKDVQLRFERQDASPCAEMVIFPQLNISRELKMGKDNKIDLPELQPGEYDFHCQMQMYKGKLVAESAISSQ